MPASAASVYVLISEFEDGVLDLEVMSADMVEEVKVTDFVDTMDPETRGKLIRMRLFIANVDGGDSLPRGEVVRALVKR